MTLYLFFLLDSNQTMNDYLKFRLLFENTDDIIFFLDRNNQIISVNPVVEEHLAYIPSDLIGITFTELIYEQSHSGQVFGDRVLFLEKIADARRNEKILSFRVVFETAHEDTCEMLVNMEFIASVDSEMLYIRAQRILEDISLKYCVEESQTYILGNNMREAELLRQRITANLPRYFNSETTTSISIGLQELLMNAIEHGNLGISFKEKGEAMESGNLRTLIRERQKLAPYKERKLYVSYALTPLKVEYTIEDRGSGFDHRVMTTRDITDPAEVFLLHGRGIRFAQVGFDEIEYNEVGNRVRIAKHVLS